MPSTFLNAHWRKLIMAQYAIDPAILAPWLPLGTVLDLFQGQCFVSLVGFLFERVRLKGISIPFHTRFEEVNLRFYVRAQDADGSSRRGVVFLSEFVPLPAITLVANRIYEEPYATLPTRHTIAQAAKSLSVEYGWRHRGTWQRLAVEASPEPHPIAPYSIEEFITEHYWGFTRRRAGYTSQYAVEHPRWEVYPILSHTIDANFAALYGPSFAHLNSVNPDNILLAEGSAVSVGSGSQIAP
jgi:uncharacterized protein YqjF (DUF2071 family)